MSYWLFVTFVGLLLVACLLALWRGGGPERVVAVTFACGWLASRIIKQTTSHDYLGTAYWTLGVDLLMLVVLIAVMQRANRAWPVAVVSLQLLVVLAHGARILSPQQLPFVYIIMTECWPYLQLIILLTGTSLLWRRTATGAVVPSWKN